MNKKSAKDIAFDKECGKYRHQIRDLEAIIKCKDSEIGTLEEISAKKDEQIRILNDWVDRLLEYTEMTKEDLQKLIQKDKEIEKATKNLNDLMGVFSQFRGFY